MSDIEAEALEIETVEAENVDYDAPPAGEAEELDGETLDGLETELVTEDQVRRFLKTGFAGVGLILQDEHWPATEEELDEVVPPLTNNINHSPLLRRLIQQTDSASGWGLLALMIFRRILGSVQRARKAKSRGDQEGTQRASQLPYIQNNGQTGQESNDTAGNDDRASATFN